MGPKTRVVCLLDSLVEIGGAETLAIEMIVRLDPARFDRILVLTRWSDEVAGREPARSALERLRQAGVRVVGLPRRRRLAIRPWVRLLRLLRDDVAIVHAHKFGSNLWGSIFGRLARVPVVVAHEHMWSYADAGRLRSFLDRDVIARLSDAFIAVSEEGRRQMIDVQGVDPREITLIPNGIPSPPPGDRAAARSRLEIPGDAPVVGTLANLRPEKALEVLIEAAALLAPTRPELRVLIAGEGPEREALERLAAEHGVTGIVDLLGYRSDTADLVSAFDVAVCCSDFEGGPLSVMEYMAAAKPIVATAVGGLPELLDGAAELVPPRDPPALAEALARLLDDGAAGRELGAAAQARQRERYGIEGWVGRIEALYDELLAAKRSQAAA